MTMSVGRMCKHFAAQVVQCGKESHHPMPVVIIVRVRIWSSPSGRPVWVHSQSPALALLVAAQNHTL